MCSDECTGLCGDCGTQADFDEVEHDRTGGPSGTITYVPESDGNISIAFDEVVRLIKEANQFRSLLATADEALGAVMADAALNAEAQQRTITTLCDQRDTWKLSYKKVYDQNVKLEERITRQKNTLIQLLNQGVDIVSAAYAAEEANEPTL